jgi:hypothetical protein
LQTWESNSSGGGREGIITGDINSQATVAKEGGGRSKKKDVVLKDRSGTPIDTSTLSANNDGVGNLTNDQDNEIYELDSVHLLTEKYSLDTTIETKEIRTRMDVVDTALSLIVPDANLVSDNVDIRGVTKKMAHAQLLSMIGNVTEVQTSKIRYWQDLYEYKFKVFGKNGKFLRNDRITRKHRNYSQFKIVDKKISYENFTFFPWFGVGNE